ncbi:MAG: tyrosine-type recombinase/integrase [Aulosira sp. ZfuCHP01]|nr:tyrosine-type recombinase/integrase [Aulosira sp. ZfuVER01]MDZ8002351.1 tyrosine-type recombinase/integrase [Aulosira sp. DedVER01a]MDZ8056541.1 tyrosine-type recombinase/integrase [Aulosira sp. ZfuCHP01]
MVAQDDKWISVDRRSGNLVIRFRVKGFSKQFYVASGLQDTKRNREAVRLKRDAILNDITLGRFDPSLESYQFRASAIAPVSLAPKKPKSECEYSIQTLWEKFTEFQSTQLAETTILGRYGAIASIINRLPTRSLADAPEIRNWLLGNYSHFMAWQALCYFSQCCQWASHSKLIVSNPFAKVQIQKPKRKSNEKEEFQAFTIDQRDLIIEAFEQHHSHSHYAGLIKFLFWTGCRHGEAFALTWSDVNEDCSEIIISKSCNYYAVNKGTKNGKRRIFRCQQETKLQKLLLSIRPQNTASSQLIFTSKAGFPMRTHTLFRVWNKHNMPNKVKIGVVKELAQRGLVPYLNAYSTRHTFATWAIASGHTADKVAYWIGDSIETVLKHYCHPSVSSLECPDF